MAQPGQYIYQTRRSCTSHTTSLQNNVRNNNRRPPRIVLTLVLCSFDEITDLLYSTRTFYFDSPLDLIVLYKSIPLHHFNRIRSLRIIFCSLYASPRSETNANNWKRVVEILHQMPDLQTVHIVLSHFCWHEYFYIQSHPGLDLKHGSLPWARSSYRCWDIETEVEEISQHMEWVKEIKCAGEFIVQIYREQRPRVYGLDASPMKQLPVNDWKFLKFWR